MAFKFLWGDAITRYGSVGQGLDSWEGMYLSADSISGLQIADGIKAGTLAFKFVGGTSVPSLYKELLFPESGSVGGLPDVALHRRVDTGFLGSDLWQIYRRGWLCLYVHVNPTGVIEVYQRSNSGIGGSFASTTFLCDSGNEKLQPGADQSVQFWGVCDSSAGEVHIGINGIEVGSETGVRTNNAFIGNTLYDLHRIITPGVGSLHQDWAVGMDDGLGGGGLPPDGSMFEDRPVQDVIAEFDPGLNNWDQVNDEVRADGFATKTSTDTVDAIDMQLFGAPAFIAGTVHGVMLSALVRKDVAGAGTLRLVYESEAAGQGEERSLAAGSAQWRHRSWVVQPSTGLAIPYGNLATIPGGYQRVS